MPIKKLCPRCRRVIEHNQKRCVECTARMNKDYDRTKRDKSSKEFYNSKAWLQVRQLVISKYHGLDMYELVINKRIVYADTVHHIEELKDNPSKALDITNLIPLSLSSHAAIHKMYDKDKKSTQKMLNRIISNDITLIGDNLNEKPTTDNLK